MSTNGPQDALEEQLNPSGTETGIFNPESGVGVQCRDDGCLELYAGGTSILIDGKNGVITMSGERVNTVASMVNVKTTPDGFNLGTGAFAPNFLPSFAEAFGGADGSPLVGAVAEALQIARSPLTVDNPAKLTTPLVVGPADASKGQTNMPLAQLVKPKPMFRALKRAQDMYKVVKAIADEFKDT